MTTEVNFNRYPGIDENVAQDRKGLKIPMYGLEINVAYACQLKCEYCSHMSKYLMGPVPVGKITQWYRSWHQRVHPKTFTVLGGEPLLHPNIVEVLSVTKKHWCDSAIQMVTNGLLLSKASMDLFAMLRQTGIFVAISKHFDQPEHHEKIMQGVELLKEYGVRHEIRFCYNMWRKSYRLDESGRPVPYGSVPERAWQNCFVRHNCMTLMDNRIYKCPQIACFRHAYTTGRLSDDWRFLLDYPPLHPEAPDTTVVKFLNEGANPACRLCPESFEFATDKEKRGHTLEEER